MELWKDTINPSSISSDKLSGGTADEASLAPNSRSADSLSISTNIDGISLKDLISRKSAALESNKVLKKSDVSLSFSKAGAHIYVPQSLAGQELTVSLYTLQGRLMMTKHFATQKGNAKSYLVNFDRKNSAAKALYLIKAKIGSIEKVLSIPVF